MTNKWNFIPPRPEVLLNRNELVEVTGYSPVTCQLLVQRGIATLSEVKKFFRPNLFNLHDPYLMPDMEKAVLRLNKAIGNKERILVYGDYDVDGTTAVTLVYKYLRNITSYIDYYIPDRDGEGSGISFKGIDYAAERNITLIITLDCGIKAVDKIKYAKEKGIDTIICDHHKPDETLPDATAILNPLCYGSTYPYEHLSGCGVGFKFMQAFALSNDMPFATLEKMLELVALSIAADIVPITGENRILAYYGLRQLNLNPSLGIKGIIDVCGLAGKELTINDVVFKIGPRINASGRMMNARETVELLLARDSASAREKSENVNKYNDERRELDKKITDQANAILDELNNNDDQKAVILYDPNWRSGVIGIVASRLSEKYYKPAVVFTRSTEPGMITGSARSTNSFDVYRAVESCNDVLENFGGHTYAVGLSIKEERLQDFIDRFLAYADKEIHADQMVPQIDIDAHIPFSSITPKLTAELRRMNPFGPHNQKPVFYTSGVKDFGLSKLVGKELEHIKLELIDKTVQTPVQAIAFGMSQHLEHIKSNKPFDICYTIEENNFAGAVSIQLLIKDIRTEAG
ncbi:MAG: single-stranded-DNA-specific exonuclease RecJ [Tannerellaceae bacterium]|jgi:single-stranded-DNA-specific exonuclease|nr:single-stranded-DNA-specific exonuclease RecJ [Tannerellaceae bacterium]